MFAWLKETPITLSIAAATVIAFLLPSATGVLAFETAGNLAGQIGQLFTCHVLHWSFDHLGWDLFMFVLVGMICERKSQFHFVIVLLVSAISIPIFVAHLAPWVSSYRGLSGIDTALFGFAAILMIQESVKDKNRFATLIYVALLIGMLVKIGYELTCGGTLFASCDSFSPVPIAHVVGALVGAVVALATRVQGMGRSTMLNYQKLEMADRRRI